MLILYTESSKHLGGQELQALLQMETFSKKGYHVLLACPPESKIAQVAVTRGIPVILIPFRNSFHLPSILKMRKLIKQHAPNMIVSHSGHDSNSVAIAVLLSLRFSIPVIRQKTYLTRNLKSFSRHFFKKIVVPSVNMKEVMVQAGCKSEQIDVIHPGFDFEKMRDNAYPPLPSSVSAWLSTHKDTSSPLIVQVGFLRKEKGHDFILKVLSSLKKEGIHFYYLIVGKGDREQALKKSITILELEDCVFMAGEITPVEPIYRKADLVVMPSRNESFGMVVVEAAFFSVPVIASNVGGIPNIITDKENGTVLPPDDFELWRIAIRECLTHRQKYQTMANQAQEDVMKRYDINKTITGLEVIAGTAIDVNDN